MPDEKTPPEGQDTGVQKTAEQVVAELKAENEKTLKRLKDQEEMIGRQSTEIGELRKKVNPEPKPDAPDKDELVEEIYQDLRKDGLDEETARYNAKILAKSGVKIIDKRLGDRMMAEVVDLVEEAMEEKKIDESVYKENEADILSEFRGRKLAPTARKNYKILRECYENVTRRKADALRSVKEKEDADKRDKDIANGSIPPAGTRQPVTSDDDKKAVEAIRNAGTKRGSAFF
jgi:hypothetical protein